MSQYPECKHGHGDPNSECQQCNADDRIVELEAKLKAIQEELNEYKHEGTTHYITGHYTRVGEYC